MALTRKFLTAMGVDAEKIDEIINAHTETVDALKEERDKYKADADALPAIQKELDDLKQAAEKNKDNPYKAQYEELKSEFDAYKADIEKKQTLQNKTDAYKALLQEAKISDKRLASILKVSQDDIDKIEFDAEGKVKDSDKIVKAITEEWADFVVTEGTKGADKNNPPASSGGAMTKEDILKISDTSERQRAMAENHELFGF